MCDLAVRLKADWYVFSRFRGVTRYDSEWSIGLPDFAKQIGHRSKFSSRGATALAAILSN